MKKFTDNVIRKRYEQYGDKTVDFLINVYNALADVDKDLNDYYYCVFDLLVIQVYLYITTQEQLLNSSDLTSKDNYNRMAKSPLIAILQKCHSQILDILQKLSLGKLEQAKLKRLKIEDESSAEEILNKLIE